MAKPFRRSLDENNNLRGLNLIFVIRNGVHNKDAVVFIDTARKDCTPILLPLGQS